jgi:hypothetical protein
MLWDLGGEGARQVFNSWKTAVKLAWEVPRGTRTYLVQRVLSSGVMSARCDILARYGNFYRSLRKSPSYEVSVMANLAGRDLRSSTGRNLKLLEEYTGINPWVFGSARLKEELLKWEMVETPDQDRWRVEYLFKLLGQRQVSHYNGDEDEEKRIAVLIDSLCVN